MNLSPHFTLKEFTQSKTADALGLSNVPSPKQIESGKNLCLKLLEPIRAALRSKINLNAVLIVTSGYRSPVLNKAVGGANTSQHKRFEAADIHAEDGNGNLLMSAQGLFNFIGQQEFIWDQIIMEFGQWVHISLKPSWAGINRRQTMYAWRNHSGKTVYTTKQPQGEMTKHFVPIT